MIKLRIEKTITNKKERIMQGGRNELGNIQ